MPPAVCAPANALSGPRGPLTTTRPAATSAISALSKLPLGNPAAAAAADADDSTGVAVVCDGRPAAAVATAAAAAPGVAGAGAGAGAVVVYVGLAKASDPSSTSKYVSRSGWRERDGSYSAQAMTAWGER